MLDARRAERDAAAADRRRAREARVKAAELDLSYSTRARADRAAASAARSSTSGNLVGESGQDTVLAQIVQVDPIHVYFAPTERDRLDVLRGATEGRIPASSEGHPGASSCSATARPIRTRASSTTSTRRSSRRAAPSRARARAEPGRRAQARASSCASSRCSPTSPTRCSCPQRAVLDEQGGSYVLVVERDDTVERRPVALGRMRTTAAARSSKGSRRASA